MKIADDFAAIQRRQAEIASKGESGDDIAEMARASFEPLPLTNEGTKRFMQRLLSGAAVAQKIVTLTKEELVSKFDNEWKEKWKEIGDSLVEMADTTAADCDALKEMIQIAETRFMIALAAYDCQKGDAA